MRQPQFKNMPNITNMKKNNVGLSHNSFFGLGSFFFELLDS